MTPRTVLLAVGLTLLATLAVDPFGHTSAAVPADATSTVWADLDCSGDVTATDGIVILAAQAGAGTHQAQYCPAIGNPVSADGGPTVPFGDLNCDGVTDARDTIALLYKLIGVTGTAGPAAICPAVGASVQLAVLADELTIDSTWRDYGDAPDGTPTGYSTGAAVGQFPTKPAHGGPSHTAPFGAVLGETATVEPAPAVGNDLADDGLLYTQMQACGSSEALVMLNTAGLTTQQRSQPLYLNIFADWNRDGTWSGSDSCAPEAAVVNQPVDVSGAVNLDVAALDFTGGAQVGELWVRIVLTTQPYTPGSADIQGETEDYLLVHGQAVPAAAVLDGIAQPQEDENVNEEFICKGAVVPHGKDSKMTLDIEQTTDSKTSGFQIKTIQAKVSQPTDVLGGKITGVTLGTKDINLKTLKDGRTQLRLSTTVTSPQDAPDRLDGPHIVEIDLSGKDQKGKDFSGKIYCAFYIDHSGGAKEQTAGKDGFKGGPGHVGDPGIAQPQFITVPHGSTVTIASDATEGNDDTAAPKYDKTTLTVFGPDGKQLAAADYAKTAGIKKIDVPGAGRALKIQTVQDKRDHPVEPIVIRIKGKLKDGTAFTDYYRIIIVHEKGAKADKLVKDFSLFFASNDHSYQNGDEAIALTYAVDEKAIAMQVPPANGLTFDPETVCTAASGDQLISPIAYAGTGDEQSVWQVRGGFVQRYPSGASDFFGLYDPYSVAAGAHCDDPAVSTNLTGYGPNSPFAVEHPSWCYGTYAFTEVNRPADTVRQAFFGQSGPFPLTGGDGYRDSSCFYAMDQTVGLTARKVNNDGTSDAWFVPYCNPVCPTNGTLPATPKLLVKAPGANQHILGAVVSPDATKIAWTLATLTADGQSFVDGQVWVADFNLAAMTVGNAQVLTTNGLNLHPQWSPDGSQIAFDSNRDSNSEVYIMNVDGSNQTNVTNTPDLNETQPAWTTP